MDAEIVLHIPRETHTLHAFGTDHSVATPQRGTTRHPKAYMCINSTLPVPDDMKYGLPQASNEMYHPFA
jgi:hypothetical protein